MHLNVYFKALLSGLNEIFEFVGKVQSVIGAIIAVLAIFYTANFTAYLEPIQPYYPQIIIVIAFIALFISGYRAWLKVYKTQEVKDQRKTEITVSKSEVVIRSYAKQHKIQKIGLTLNFVVINFNKHPVHVKGFDFNKIKVQLGLPKMTEPFPPNNYSFPIIVESNNLKELHFNPAYDIESMSFIEQVKTLKEIISKTYYTTTEIISVNGKETLDIQINFENSKLLALLKENSYGFNQSIIDEVL